MKLKDLKNKSEGELRELLDTDSKKIAQIGFEHARSRSKNVKEAKELKRERARILTLLREKRS